MPTMLHKWRRAILERRSLREEAQALMPVIVGEAEALPTETGSAISTREASGVLKIELPRARIEVHGRIDPEALYAALAVLRPR